MHSVNCCLFTRPDCTVRLVKRCVCIKLTSPTPNFQTKALPAAQSVFARRMVPLVTLRYINVIKRNLYKSFRMKKTSSNSPWNPIATAPAHVELELCVHDGEEYHVLAFPCRRNGVGWSDVRLNKMVPTDALATAGIRAHVTGSRQLANIFILPNWILGNVASASSFRS